MDAKVSGLRSLARAVQPAEFRNPLCKLPGEVKLVSISAIQGSPEFQGALIRRLEDRGDHKDRSFLPDFHDRRESIICRDGTGNYQFMTALSSKKRGLATVQKP